MTEVQILRAMKHKAELKIAAIVKEFHEETGLVVTGLTPHIIEQIGGQTILSVKIEVEL